MKRSFSSLLPDLGNSSSETFQGSSIATLCPPL
jgi:hypothetical protein